MLSRYKTSTPVEVKVQIPISVESKPFLLVSTGMKEEVMLLLMLSKGFPKLVDSYVEIEILSQWVHMDFSPLCPCDHRLDHSHIPVTV